MPISYCSEWTTASGKIRRAYPGGVEKEVGYTYRGEKLAGHCTAYPDPEFGQSFTNKPKYSYSYIQGYYKQVGIQPRKPSNRRPQLQRSNLQSPRQERFYIVLGEFF